MVSIMFLIPWLCCRCLPATKSLLANHYYPRSYYLIHPVRDRLHAQNRPEPAKTHLKLLMNEDDNVKNDAPIADLFLNCTVLFADIAGFTSWSSERAPAQVFILLETIYGAFDKIADRRGVFKVETIGDCYMAVTGLPNPNKDHALIMARFARDCRDQMNALTKSLEVTLGPDTSNLVMRFGLHSGQVIAGVLRGQKSRFQLFGDT
jgi:class 3 adenylate cyclase